LSIGPHEAIALSIWSRLRALPCQPFLSSTSGTPLPLIVAARIIVGVPSTCAADANASTTAGME